MTEEIETTEYGDLFLKFTSEEEATQILEGYLGSIDVIGFISTPSGETATDADGNEIPVMTFIDGWHVNTRGPITLELKEFSVLPTHPRRVWA